jgi:hypothetical protein
MEEDKDKTPRLLTEKEKNIIIELEDSLLIAHFGSDPYTQIHWCRYCGNTWHWGSPIVHTEDCPITLLNRLRRIFDIPNWMVRFAQKTDK